jgi:quercetin dioxygenase-like cupin family protein
MNRTVRMLTTALTIGIAAGMLGNKVLIAQQAPVTRTVLQQRDLDGGREVIMYRADVGPAGIAGRHYHPGPEMFYVLEGALSSSSKGSRR